MNVLYANPTTQLTIRHTADIGKQRVPKIKIERLSFWYGKKQALNNVSLEIYANAVTALIGPSGCGKTTFLRCLNRMKEIIPDTTLTGRIAIGATNVYDPHIDSPEMRQRFGWIAQRPDPFPWSIRSNILYGPTLRGRLDGREADAIVEKSLRAVGLWAEVKDRLANPALDLSLGQQQRLCIARAIASKPEIILMDEPCSALDPTATAVIEDLIIDLRTSYTVVIVTHNLQQAARIADRIAFFYLGELVEVGDAEQIINNPQFNRCRDFVSGHCG